MRNAYLTAAAVCCSALLSTGCGKTRYVHSPAPTIGLHQPETRLTPHVLLVSIDGLRPDAISLFGASTLTRLMSEGSYTLDARTISPSRTLPSHTSMLTGELPDRHGVLWNDVLGAAADAVDLPTVFGVARAQGYNTAAFFSKAKFQHLQQPGTLDYSQAPGGWFGRWGSRRTVRDVEKHLVTAKPNLLFVHLPDPDRAGHDDGWMSASYGRAVRSADAAVGRLLVAAGAAYGEGNFTVIVTADHGGHGFDHGSDDPRDVAIPWIAWGRGVRSGALQEAAVRTIDTASTVLWLLGVNEPADWAGTPVANAFTARVAPERQ